MAKKGKSISARVSTLAHDNLMAEVSKDDRNSIGYVLNKLLEGISSKKKPGKVKKVADKTEQEACRVIWQFYSSAYEDKYRVKPVRNVKVNSQIKQLNERLGSDAAFVAGWFLTVTDPFVVKMCHSVDSLLKNAEAYKTQALTGYTPSIGGHSGKSKQSDGERFAEQAARAQANHERTTSGPVVDSHGNTIPE